MVVLEHKTRATARQLKERDKMIENFIKVKADNTRVQIAQLEGRLQGLERQATELANRKGIKAWLNNEFESSCSLTREFSAFARDFKRHIVKIISNDLELVNWNEGHFDISGFLKNKVNDKLVYFSISDVRHFPDDWYNHVLIRTAEHDEDYSGGSNYYATLENLATKARELTK